MGIRGIDWWDWLSIVGVLFILGGAWVTVRELSALAHKLFPGVQLPHVRGWQWVRLIVQRRRPVNHFTTATLSGGIGISSSARGFVTPGHPAPFARESEWRRYLDGRLNALQQQIEWANEDRQKVDDKFREDFDSLATEVRAAIADLDVRTREWIGGSKGAGLSKAWWGLVFSLLGVVMQTVASVRPFEHTAKPATRIELLPGVTTTANAPTVAPPLSPPVLGRSSGTGGS